MNSIDRIRAFNRFYTNQIGLLGRVRLKDLSLTDARVLYEVGIRQRTNARELAGQLEMDEGYLSRVLKDLQKRELISRVPSEQDARVRELTLTDFGRARYAELEQSSKDAVHEMIADLPGACVDQILEAMDIVQGVLDWPNGELPGIREVASGDVGWVIKRHGEVHAAENGFDMSFEALVAKILAEFVEKKNQPREKGWIAHANGQRLGCVFVVEDDEATARLRLMLVERFARGKGIGQTLVEQAIAHARKQGFTRMVLWTQQRFEAACRLYARNGFRLSHSEPNRIFGQNVVDQVWERDL